MDTDDTTTTDTLTFVWTTVIVGVALLCVVWFLVKILDKHFEILNFFIYFPNVGQTDFTKRKIIHSGDPHGKMRVVVFHGNAMTAAEIAYMFKDSPHDVWCVEYPGYGETDGTPTTASCTEFAAEALSKALNEQDENGSFKRTVLLGHSLGSGVAVQGLCKLFSDSPACVAPSHVCLVSPFSSLKDAARDLLGPLSGLLCPKYDTVGALSMLPTALKGKVRWVVAHGNSDHIVRIDQGKKVHEALGRAKELSTFMELEAGHNFVDFHHIIEHGTAASPDPTDHHTTDLPTDYHTTDLPTDHHTTDLPTNHHTTDLPADYYPTG
jgi:predicted esterase